MPTSANAPTVPDELMKEKMLHAADCAAKHRADKERRREHSARSATDKGQAGGHNFAGGQTTASCSK